MDETKFNSTPITANQYLFSSERIIPPSDFETHARSSLHFAFDRNLPLIQMCDADGVEFGTVLGFPYDLRHHAVLTSQVFKFDASIGSTADLERLVLPRLAGSFIMITGGLLPPRLYPDHGGSLPVVYSPELRAAGSSPAILLPPQQYSDWFDHQLHRDVIAREGVGSWISGDLTAHRGVRRLLPNHYLDLRNWEARRYWPRATDFGGWIPFEDSVERASHALGGFVTAWAKTTTVALTLTAGFDSRLLLAAASGAQEEIELVTFDHDSARLDVEVARRIASEFGLRHQIVGVTKSNERDRARWSRTIGDCILEGNQDSYLTLRQVQSPWLFTGMYGEIGRCRLYRQDLAKINSKKIDTGFVVGRLTIPRNHEMDASIETWLSGLQGLPSSVILDLAFLELRFGSWAMGQHPIQNAYKMHILPYAQRPVIESFMWTEPRAKTTERLFGSCINRLWPGLGTIPINKYGDWRDHALPIAKVVKAGRVRRYLRDRFAR